MGDQAFSEKIKSFEENQLSTEQRQRKVVGQLIVFSVGLYVIFAFVFYFCFFAAELRDQIIYLIPLLVFPILVLCLRRLLKWYYHRKLLHNHDQLSDMRNQKKKLLEEVMEKETYKVAKQILEKFAPDQLRKTQGIPASPQVRPPLPRPQLALPPGSVSEVELRRRSMGQFPHQPRMSISSNTNSPPGLAIMGQSNGQGYPRPPSLVGPGPPMPRPVFPRERSYLDKMVEYLLGDGPGNRYALICKQCESHNGMALKEEFEYFSFRCCYCYFWNPARKQRPTAPALTPPVKDPSSENSSSSELNSASDSEEADDPEEKKESKVEKPSKAQQENVPELSNEMTQEPTEH
uniref:Endoplasmic reticulum junction formation protein lunapark n=1 Tax=Timema douglasi TaxID=61478 RepID=A0A7R8V8V2_TIMDO|nr:unnamed protein product [Timema douglasi]